MAASADGRPPEPLPFGELVKHHRQEAGLTQEALAELAGITPRGLRYLEAGARVPYRYTVRRLASALGLEGRDQEEFTAVAGSGVQRSVSASTTAAWPSRNLELIGREHELTDLTELLKQPSVQVVSVTGPGGVGKTQTAVEVALSLEGEFADGAFWIPLADIDDPALVAPAIVQALGGTGAEGMPDAELIVARLGNRAALLLLDNFEHVASAAAVVASIAASCPRVKVLVTSRAALHLHSEREYSLAPLPVPGPAEPDAQTIASNPAVELFVQRAQAIDHRFTLNDVNAPAVAEICRRLEGLPLALELAAARARTLSPVDILTRLDRRLALLSGGPIDSPARQRTLRDTLDWSYQLLEAADQFVLRRLSVFWGGAGLDAVVRVCGSPDGGSVGVLDSVDGLRRNSLLTREEVGAGETRLRLLETVREYALEQLGASPGEEVDARNQHAGYYADLAVDLAYRVQGPDQVQALGRLEQEHDNIRAALRWWLQTHDATTGLRVAGALWMFWYIRGHLTEGRSHLASLLALPEADEPDTNRALPLLGAGQLARAEGDYQSAAGLMRESIAVYRSSGDAAGLPGALLGAGFVARMQEDYDQASSFFKEALQLARAADDRYITAAALHHLGMISAERDANSRAALALLEESLALYRQIGFPRHIALLLATLSNVERTEGSLTRASELLQESLRMLVTSGEQFGIHGALEDLANLAMDEGQPHRAVRLAGAAAKLRQRIGALTNPATARRREAWLREARKALGDAQFEIEWSEGEAMSTDNALAEATAGSSQVS